MLQKLIDHKWPLKLFLLVCVGCSSASPQGNAALSVTTSARNADFMQSRTAEQLWANPLSVPPFLFIEPGAFRHDLLPTQKMCVKVRQDAIWEPGDKQHDDFTREVLARSSFKVDNAEISLRKLIVSQPISQIPIIDKTGNEVAVVGAPLEYCVNLSTVSIGLHKASIQVDATSGTIYAYAWAFRVAKASSSIEGL